MVVQICTPSNSGEVPLCNSTRKAGEERKGKEKRFKHKNNTEVKIEVDCLQRRKGRRDEWRGEGEGKRIKMCYEHA